MIVDMYFFSVSLSITAVYVICIRVHVLYMDVNALSA